MLRLLIILMLLASPALADPIKGVPRIVDGDSIVIADVRIRLHGIDAPEAKQTCTRDGTEWGCGLEATMALAAMIERNWVECEERDRDRFGRIVATCTVGGPRGIDLNRRMVSDGWAVAYRRYSMDYVDAEGEAREAGRGIWSGDFVTPEEWRRQRRR